MSAEHEIISLENKEGAFKYLVKRVTTLEQQVSAKHKESIIARVELDNARYEVHMSRRAVRDLKIVKMKNKRLKKKLDKLDHERWIFEVFNK
jgi:predicted RNase H-like nuclease (RuvC/YqgF family)